MQKTLFIVLFFTKTLFCAEAEQPPKKRIKCIHNTPWYEVSSAYKVEGKRSAHHLFRCTFDAITLELAHTTHDEACSTNTLTCFYSNDTGSIVKFDEMHYIIVSSAMPIRLQTLDSPFACLQKASRISPSKYITCKYNPTIDRLCWEEMKKDVKAARKKRLEGQTVYNT